LFKKTANWIAQQAAWKLLLWAIGGGLTLFVPALLFFIIISVIINTTGSFLFGFLTGVHIGGKVTQAHWTNQDANIKTTYRNVAAQWETGMDATQQQIVKQYQAYLPTSVLLTFGKFVNNYNKGNGQQTAAQNYYNDLLAAPYLWQGTGTLPGGQAVNYTIHAHPYAWVKGQAETITKYWAESCSPKGGCYRYIATTITPFTVWELREAKVWDGDFTSQWKTETIGQFAPDGTGTETIEPVMTAEHMAYNWSRFYAAAAKFKFTKTDVNPLWFDAIFSMQWAEYQAGNGDAYLNDPNVDQWGPEFGQQVIVLGAPVGKGHVANPVQVNQWINSAITLDSAYGISSSWVPIIVQIIGIESGGNPKAYNPDLVEYYVNPPTYEHAEGIMQTMPSTFGKYALPGYQNIWNPVDNIAAAMLYIKADYGNPSKALASESTGGY
jgi:hypothetical protein